MRVKNETSLENFMDIPASIKSYREGNFETLCISSGNNHLVNQRVAPVNTGTQVDRAQHA